LLEYLDRQMITRKSGDQRLVIQVAGKKSPQGS
jgi:Elongation factor SelB, winged helix